MRVTLCDFISAHLFRNIAAEAVLSEKVCAFTGAPLPVGASAVALKSVIKPATANLADTFRYPSDVVLPSVAQCFAESRLLRGNLFITESSILSPMVSGVSAKKADRPTWLEIFRQTLDGRQAVFVLTEESKRRLWLDACVTETNDTFRVFLNEGATCQNLEISKSVVLDALSVVVECLENGFSKTAIRSSLFSHVKRLQAIGFARTRELEKACCLLRGSPEFQVATFIGTLIE